MSGREASQRSAGLLGSKELTGGATPRAMPVSDLLRQKPRSQACFAALAEGQRCEWWNPSVEVHTSTGYGMRLLKLRE